MDDFFLVEALQTQHHLVENAPDIVFFCKFTNFFGVIYFTLQISIITIFHHDA